MRLTRVALTTRTNISFYFIFPPSLTSIERKGLHLLIVTHYYLTSNLLPMIIFPEQIIKIPDGNVVNNWTARRTRFRISEHQFRQRLRGDRKLNGRKWIPGVYFPKVYGTDKGKSECLSVSPLSTSPLCLPFRVLTSAWKLIGRDQYFIRSLNY